MDDPNTSELTRWVDREARDRDGDKIGKVADVYADDDTGQPEWLAIKTGLFGTRVSFVPIEGARVESDIVVVEWDKATVKDAPHMEVEGSLTPEEEHRLYQHYGMSGMGSLMGTEMTGDVVDVPAAERTAGRARLRKWYETEPGMTLQEEHAGAGEHASGEQAVAGEHATGERSTIEEDLRRERLLTPEDDITRR